MTSKKSNGGKARAAKLTADERRLIAQKAAAARWERARTESGLGRSTHMGNLAIANLRIPCFVLEDGKRVISGRGVTTAIGMRGRGTGASRITSHQSLKPYLSPELITAIDEPLEFTGVGAPHVTSGYEATVLQQLCDAVIAADQAGALTTEQEKRYANQCLILLRAFAKVGIVALVDEATGFQDERAKNALAEILQAFIAKELQPWVSTFPEDFYKEMFRLRGLQYPQDTLKRPLYFGSLTNDVVYKRLAPGVLHELKRSTPRSPSGRHKHKLFQRLTSNIGYPKLREHLGSVVAIMKLSTDWGDFMEKLDKIHRPYNHQIPLGLEYDAASDDGKGI